MLFFVVKMMFIFVVIFGSRNLFLFVVDIMIL